MSIRVVACVLLVGFLLWGARSGGLHQGRAEGRAEGYKAGAQMVRTEWDASNQKAKAEGERQAREQEARDAARTKEANDERTTTEQEHARQLAANRAVLDGLQRDLANARSAITTASADAVRAYAAAATDVLGQCTRRVVELAAAADGHAADSLMLQRAWPAQEPAR